MKLTAPDAAAATAQSPVNWSLGIFVAVLTIISMSAAADTQISAAGLNPAEEWLAQATAGVIWLPINALFVVGDSFSATGPVTDPSANLQKWPVFLSNLLGIVYTQSRNQAEAYAQIETISLDGRIIPGLLDQLRAMPAGRRKSGLLVIWI